MFDLSTPPVWQKKAKVMKKISIRVGLIFFHIGYTDTSFANENSYKNMMSYIGSIKKNRIFAF